MPRALTIAALLPALGAATAAWALPAQQGAYQAPPARQLSWPGRAPAPTRTPIRPVAANAAPAYDVAPYDVAPHEAAPVSRPPVIPHGGYPWRAAPPGYSRQLTPAQAWGAPPSIPGVAPSVNALTPAPDVRPVTSRPDAAWRPYVEPQPAPWTRAPAPPSAQPTHYAPGYAVAPDRGPPPYAPPPPPSWQLAREPQPEPIQPPPLAPAYAVAPDRGPPPAPYAPPPPERAYAPPSSPAPVASRQIEQPRTAPLPAPPSQQTPQQTSQPMPEPTREPIPAPAVRTPAPSPEPAPAPVEAAPLEAPAEPAPDPMAPRRDALIFQLQRNAPPPAPTPPEGPAPTPTSGAPTSPDPAQAPRAAATRDGGSARYYSVHRQAGRQPDATPLPAPVYLDALPVELDNPPAATDLAEPPAAPTLIRDVNGRLRAAPMSDDPL